MSNIPELTHNNFDLSKFYHIQIGFYISKFILKNYGGTAAIVLGALMNQYERWYELQKLRPDGSFYCTIPSLESLTGIKEDAQRDALKKLSSVNLLECKNKGCPRVRYIRFNPNALVALFDYDKKFEEKVKDCILPEEVEIHKPTELELEDMLMKEHWQRIMKNIQEQKESEENQLEETTEPEDNNLGTENKRLSNGFEHSSAPGISGPNNNLYVKNNNQNKNHKYILNQPSSVESSLSSKIFSKPSSQEYTKLRQVDPPAEENVSSTKNKLMQNQKPADSISNIIGDKMSDINNEEAKQKQKIKEVKQMEKAIKTRITKSQRRINYALDIAKQRTQDKQLIDSLHTYLQIMDERPDRQIPGGLQWNKLLDKLFGFNVSNEQMIKIINTSCEAGYASFYLPNNYKQSNNRPGLHVENAYSEVDKSDHELSEDQF